MIRQLLLEPRHLHVCSSIAETVLLGETRQGLIEHALEQNAVAIVRRALTLCHTGEVLRNRFSAGLLVWFAEQYAARCGILQDVTIGALPLHRLLQMGEEARGYLTRGMQNEGRERWPQYGPDTNQVAISARLSGD